MLTLQTGLKSLGVDVESWHDRKMRRRQVGHTRRAHALLPAEVLRQRELLAKSHRSQPFAIVVLQLASDGIDDIHRALINVLQGHDRPRIACVCSDVHPPPVWAIWVPLMCDRLFVREMRLQ